MIFKAIDEFFLKARNGRIFVVELDRDTRDFEHLMNKEVEIDGNRYIVRGVERYAHCPPWRAGEHIGLLTDA